MGTITVKEIQTRDNSKLFTVSLKGQWTQLQNKFNYCLTKVLEIAISKIFRTQVSSESPVWWKGGCCHPLVQAVYRQLVPMGWVVVLECPKEQPTQCPQFTEQVTGVAPPVTVSLTLTRSLFNVIIMLSHNLTKVMEHLFNTSRHSHAN